MKIKFKRSYKKVDKNGKLFTMFVYLVSGTTEQLAEYEETMGDNYVKDDDGNSLWFSRDRFVMETNNLIKTSKGSYVADMSKFDQMNSLAAQYGGNLGQELARSAAQSLMGITATVTTPVIIAPASVSSEKESADVE